MTEFSSDELRRQLRDCDRAQRDAMPAAEELLNYLGTDAQVTIAQPFNRRRMLSLGGISVATAAILAACGKDSQAAPSIIRQTGDPTPAPKAPEAVVDDITLLRTASSLERAAVSAYDSAASSGLLKSAAIIDAAKLFRDQHLEHAQLFESTTTRVGGEAFTTANPIVMAELITPALEDLETEADVVLFAHQLENIAAATYQLSVQFYSAPRLRQAAMSVGGVEARHAATLAGVIAGLKVAPGSGTTPLPTTTTKPTATTPTTTTKATVPSESDGVTTTTKPIPVAVFQVPAAFGPAAGALGPNSFMYPRAVETTTTTK
jgi:hypothetical protein